MEKVAPPNETFNGEELPVYGATEARKNFADIITEAYYRRPVIITKYGVQVAIVPVKLLTLFEELEDKVDVLEVMAEMKEMKESRGEGNITLAELKKELLEEATAT